MTDGPCSAPQGGPNPARLWSRASNVCLDNYSSYDLDMKRKCEIFKYKKNASHLTKKQMLSQSVKGFGSNANKVWATQAATHSNTNPNVQNLHYINKYSLLCPTRDTCCSSSRDNDVPGNEILICNVPGVPLTRYINTRTYKSSGTKFPMRSWTVGNSGFPVGKSGNSL